MNTDTDKAGGIFLGFMMGMLFAILGITVGWFLYCRGYEDGKKAAISAAKGE